jgi:cytochrome b involved in lipid metabolism
MGQAASTTTTAETVAPPKLATDAAYTMAEVATHSSAKDCWLIIEDVVYDVTNYLEHHPGGPTWLTELAGKDATDGFLNVRV